MNLRSLYQKAELYYGLIDNKISEQIIYRLDDINRIPDLRPVVPIEQKRIERVEDLLPYKDHPLIMPFWERFVYFITHGAMMNIYTVEGAFVGHNFISDLTVFKPHQFCKHPVFKAGTKNFMLFWTIVNPEYRNMKIGAYMTAVRSRDTLKNGGFLYTSTDLSNIQSYRMLMRTGFVEIGRLQYKEIAGLRLRSIFTPAVPAHIEEKTPAIPKPLVK